jgi:hypothetical protein
VGGALSPGGLAGGRLSQRRCLAHLLPDDRLLHGDLLRELLQRVLALQLLQLGRGVLVQELVDREVTTTDTDVDLVLVDADPDPLGAKLVDTLVLPHEHDLELLPLGVVVDELSETLVDRIVLHRDVDCDTLLQLNDVVFEGLDLDLGILELPEELQTGLVGLVDLVLHLHDVVRCDLELVYHVGLLRIKLCDVLPGRAQLGLHVRLLCNDLLKLDDGGVEFEDLLALSYKR